MQSELCSEKRRIPLIIHNGVLSLSDDSRTRTCKVSKTITLLQELEESAILEFSFSCYYYSYYNDYKLDYNFSLTFENNLHEVSKDYVYEIEFYLYEHKNDLSLHTLMFSHRQRRETNKFSVSYSSGEPSSHCIHQELINRILGITDKGHICCSVRRYGIKNDVDKELTQNIHVGSILLKTGLYSDVSLVVGEKLFLVHKHILSSASNIFKAMFSHDMTENRDGKVIIEDFEPEVIEGLLSFIYTGETSLLSQLPLELFKVAHKYEIQSLKAQRLENFLFIVNSENVVDIPHIASTYELTNLRSDLLKFIQNHEKEMVKEKSFQSFLCRDLKIHTVPYTLKLCDKYKELLNNVEIETFKFIKKNNKALVNNEEFLKLFETHALLMKKLYIFIHRND